MKQKLLFALMMLCMSLCSVTVWAEREQPTIPTSIGTTPEDGERYYLYNVKDQMFLCAGNSWGTQASLGDMPKEFSLSISEGNCFSITFTDTHKQLFSDNQTAVYTDYNNQGINKTHWTVTAQSDGTYTIQSHSSSPDYTENYYLGWDRGNNTVVGQMEEGAFDWIFIKSSNTSVKHYVAELKLYKALKQAEAYGAQGADIVSFEQIYSNRGSHSEAELINAASELYLQFVDRAPLIPMGEQPSNGLNYYIYNPATGLFIGSDSYSSYPKMSATATTFHYQHYADNTFMLRKESADGYFLFDGYSQTDYLTYNSTGSEWRDVWERIPADGGYKFRRYNQNRNYDENQFVGYAENNNARVNSNLNDETCVWRFVTMGDAQHYEAEVKLYNAIQEVSPSKELIVNYAYYAKMYANRIDFSTEELNNAAKELVNSNGMTRGYIAPYWNESHITWHTPDGNFGDSYDKTWALPGSSNTRGHYFYRRINKSGESTLCATVKVDEVSTFIYALSGSTSDVTVTVYVDGIKNRELINEQINTCRSALGKDTYTRYFETLEPGTHTIKWVFKSTAVNENPSCYIHDAGVMKSPLITVNLLEPGSLGTEVLYNTDHIKNVRRLKVKGKMNSDDWAKIKMMHYLQDLDLSEAEFTEIPEYQFSCQNDTSSLFIHAMKLPEGLEKINREAFYYSFIDHLEFPSTVTTVEYQAFSYSHIQELVLPDNLTEIKKSSSTQYYVFDHMYWLKKLVCPKNLTNIPYGTFYQNYYCEKVTLPEQLTKIDNKAFYQNMRMTTTFPDKLQTIGESAFYQCLYANFSPLPESLQSIGDYAFWNCNRINTLKIPENVSSIGSYAFQYCYYLTEVEIGTKIYNLSNSVFDKCTRLETLRMNCPTVVTYNTSSSSYPVTADHIKDVTLIVPNHIVTSYKLDSYWYNFKSIEGFSTAEIQDWTLERDLVLNHERLEGVPNMFIGGGGSLKINGELPMSFDNLTFWSDRNEFYGRLISNCSNIDIKGALSVHYYTHTAKEWRFVSLPFDMKIGDITSNNPNAKYAIRYYDGASRAGKGPSGSWKNYNDNDTILAGTGFIFCSNTDRTIWYFKALDNESKQQCVGNREFVKTLEVNDSQAASNKGWNFVGNPWQCYYNDHALNFAGPITVWNPSNKTYVAYSITDDDYAIRPNEAFFVQCPNAEYNTIGFPMQGRQQTSVIESQNAAKRRSAVAVSQRAIVNVKISNGETEDQTRVVLNEQASMDYELSCDAGKMMSMDSSVPQIYTLGEDNEEYAINERPVGNGVVSLGIYSATGGELTLSLGRCDVENVMLVDYETATEQPLVGSYTFTTNAGYDNGRFALKFNVGETTGIATLNGGSLNDTPCYNIAGQRVARGTKGIIVVSGRKIFNK